MDNRKFAEGYKYRTGPRYDSEIPELVEIMKEPREWSSFIGVIIYDYLNNRQGIVPFYEASLWDYSEWRNEALDSIVDIIQKHALVDPESRRYLSEMHFHTMATETIYMLEQLIRDDVFVSDERITEMQTDLAMRSAEVAVKRNDLQLQVAEVGDRSGLIGVYNGQLTENDTLIIGLEIVKMDPERKFVIVPGPPRFESGMHSSMNADFLFIDKALRQARGLQAKTRIYPNGHDLTKYDDGRITLIDGMEDLGNSLPVEYDSGHVRGVAAAPGLIAMDYLLQTDVQSGSFDPTIKITAEQAKTVADQLLGSRESYIAQATENVKGKLQHDLYKDLFRPARSVNRFYTPPEKAV
jgi:hypothetical protein